MTKAVIAVLIACLSSAAHAFSGADLLGQCKDFVRALDGEKIDLNQSLQAGLCGGYIHGVQEGFTASSELSFIASEDQGTAPVSAKYWDVPEDMEAEKVVKIVVRYLEINPEMQSKPAVLSVISALIQTFPVEAKD
ncbi:MAG: hypothetical protein JSW45_02710 [Thiotrichales bacterium]|nr:MAG: hypothetical protein JSW45_02710 [Thiotrichales bacterium]